MKKQTVDTPRDGKSWCDTVNNTPMPQGATRTVVVIGKCDANGDNFKPYDKPIERKVPETRSGSYLWLGDYRL